jgi:D-alanine-D-alanine ligase
MATGEIEKKCSEVALNAWRCIGCRDGGRVDLKMDATGVPNFIEVNPLAGINPDHSDFPMLAGKKGIDFRTLLEMIMNSAKKRIK